MKIYEALICGIIQGAAEFLPISSSGHLALMHGIFNSDAFSGSNMTFDILLHLATLFAVFIVYFKDIIALVPAFFRLVGKMFKGKFRLSDYTNEERFVLLLIFATIPLVIAVFIKDYVEIISSYYKAVGALLILNALVLFFGDRIKDKGKNISDLQRKDAVGIGLFQLLAILPGLSRSGSTITGGRIMGLTREEAVRFSFILSIPAIIGANITNVSDIADITSADILPYLIGMAAAFVAGLAAIKLLIFISKKSNFRIFSYYCFAVGILALIFG
ncbi:MAG: undecaprenyl-diphosphate phosphatase [Eubacteriales bacterium]